MPGDGGRRATVVARVAGDVVVDVVDVVVVVLLVVMIVFVIVVVFVVVVVVDLNAFVDVVIVVVGH